MSGKSRSNLCILILILFTMMLGLFCSKSDKESAESKIKKSIRVVFNMSPATVVYKNNKKVPVFAEDPREYILGHLKEAGFKIVIKEDKSYDLKLAVEYHERALSTTQYPGGIRGNATSVAIEKFNVTLFDTSGQQLLHEEYDPALRPLGMRSSDASDWFYKEISRLISGRLESEDELSFLISRIQTEDFIKILERPGGRDLLKQIGSFQDSSVIGVILPFLRVGHDFARWRVKYTLYTLDYRPRSVPEKAAWDIIDLEIPWELDSKEQESIPWGIQIQVTGPDGASIHSDPLKMHHFIAYYGLDGIRLLLEDFKFKRSKNFVNTLQNQARKGLCMLSQKNWEKAWGRGGVYLRYFNLEKITYLSKQEVYRKLGSKVDPSPFRRAMSSIDRKHFSSLFREEWNTYATENLIATLNDTLSDESYLKDVITVLGEIADKKAVEPLKPFLTHAIFGEEAKMAIQKIESR